MKVTVKTFPNAAIISQILVLCNGLTRKILARESIYLEVPNCKPSLLQSSWLCRSLYLNIKLSIGLCALRKYVLVLVDVECELIQSFHVKNHIEELCILSGQVFAKLIEILLTIGYQSSSGVKVNVRHS